MSDNEFSYKVWPFIVVGNDLFSLAQFVEFHKIYGTGSPLLLSKDELNIYDILPKRPWPFRGKGNVEIFQNVYPDIKLNKDDRMALFLKEGRLKSFGGRARPEKLLWGEAFYTHPRVSVDIKKIFSFLKKFQSMNFDGQTMLKGSVISVERISEKTSANYNLTLSNGHSLKCEKLYWGEGPSKFLEIYSQKKELHVDLINCCRKLQTPSSLYVDFSFHGPVTDCEETLFIPLSYTYEWGHFIGEFFQEEEEYKATFLAFVDPDEEDEEGISRKIRLLKRQLEKLFPSFRKSLSQEVLSLNEQSANLGIDDEVFLEAKNSLPHLRFIGPNGVIRHPKKWKKSLNCPLREISHFSRAILSLEISR